MFSSIEKANTTGFLLPLYSMYVVGFIYWTLHIHCQWAEYTFQAAVASFRENKIIHRSQLPPLIPNFPFSSCKPPPLLDCAQHSSLCTVKPTLLHISIQTSWSKTGMEPSLHTCLFLPLLKLPSVTVTQSSTECHGAGWLAY